MKVNELVPHLAASVSFDHNGASGVPAASGCYALVSASGNVLYLGQSGNMRERFGDHVNDPDKRRSTPDGRATRFHYKALADRQRTEESLLAQFRARERRLPYLHGQN